MVKIKIIHGRYKVYWGIIFLFWGKVLRFVSFHRVKYSMKANMRYLFLIYAINIA